jgi:hypothetical protein
LVVVVGEGFIGLRCRQQRRLFLLAQFGLAMDHRHGLLNIEQLENYRHAAEENYSCRPSF